MKNPRQNTENSVQKLFSTLIASRRQYLGFSQEDMAKRLVCSRRAYQRIEGGDFSEGELLSVFGILGLEIEVRVKGSVLLEV